MSLNVLNGTSTGSAGFLLQGFQGLALCLGDYPDYVLRVSLDQRFTPLLTRSFSAFFAGGKASPRLEVLQYPLRSVPASPFGEEPSFSVEDEAALKAQELFGIQLTDSGEFTPSFEKFYVASQFEIAYFRQLIEQQMQIYSANLLVLVCHTKTESHQGKDERRAEIGRLETVGLDAVMRIVAESSSELELNPLVINMQYSAPRKGGVQALMRGYAELRTNWPSEASAPCPPMVFLEHLDLWDGDVSTHFAVVQAVQQLVDAHGVVALKVGNASSLDHLVLRGGGLGDGYLNVILADSSEWRQEDRDRRSFWTEVAEACTAANGANGRFVVIPQEVPGDYTGSIGASIEAVTDHFDS